MATKFWRQGMDEYRRSFFKSAFTSALQKLLPELTEEDLVEGGAGVRALACGRDGALLDDYVFHDDKNVINVCNAPSPAATSSLSIGNHISDMILKKM
jgi:L-2-hydroxyglutarate oxidase